MTWIVQCIDPPANEYSGINKIKSKGEYLGHVENKTPQEVYDKIEKENRTYKTEYNGETAELIPVNPDDLILNATSGLRRAKENLTCLIKMLANNFGSLNPSRTSSV